ncbi:M-phase inducer phosphatase 3-like [Mya arenaria]|uniref:M-phase inducer phosphatase 3-like n=1 Tax=Mya arenaria TaxID=6604 RepID=UPI0022E6ECE7|nr:M-phase inducer phosphatase 3-like [Mya arenaria]
MRKKLSVDHDLKSEETTLEEIFYKTSTNAVERLSTNSDLVADGSRDNGLPTVAGKHKDLMAILPETMSAVLNGDYDHHIDHLTVIDCRYPYEFEGGHIRAPLISTQRTPSGTS